MDLTLGDDQQDLLDAARRFLGRSCGSTVVREAEASADGYDRKLWGVAAGMGWPALCIPEEFGGAGAGLVELGLVAEQAGWAAYTSPLLTQSTLVGLPLVWSGTTAQRDRWLPALASGEVTGTAALLAPGARDERGSPPLPAAADAKGWRLSGDRALVPFAGTCDVYMLVADLEGRGPSLVVLDSQRAGSPVRQSSLGGEPLYSVRFDGVAVESGDFVGAPGDGHVLLGRALDCAAAVWCAYAAGLAERALELSVTHAGDRHQFGRPIGSFQAVAHRCADMRADLDAMRWLARQATWALGAGRDSDGLAVSAAKAYANDALRRVFMHAHQVHGAIGFSVEHDLQLYTRRAKAIELTLGDSASHRRRVAAAMGL